MLWPAIFAALVLIYFIYVRPRMSPRTPRGHPEVGGRRVGSVFFYDDIQPSREELKTNTLAGPGGGSLIKKYVLP